MKLQHNKKTAAFTLLELMIGAAILVVALVGLIAAFTGCFNLNEGARNLSIATNHAQCVMEQMRDINFCPGITQQNWTSWAAAIPPNGGGCNTLNNENIVVTYPSGTEAVPLEILVTVNWTEKLRQKSIRIATLLAER